MKFIALPILVVLVLVQSFSHWVVVMAFNLNRDYIAKNLCENRFRPQLHCNGNCVLMKKMKAKEKEEQGQPAPRLEITSFVISSKTFFATAELPGMLPVTAYDEPADFGKPVDMTYAIFHPPLV